MTNMTHGFKWLLYYFFGMFNMTDLIVLTSVCFLWAKLGQEFKAKLHLNVSEMSHNEHLHL